MSSLTTIRMSLALTLVCLSLAASAEPVPEKTFYLKAQHSGKCVAQHGGTFEEGGAISQWTCVDQPNLRIEKFPTGSGYFLLRFQHSGKCLTVKGEGRSNGTPIIQQTCNYDGPIGQTWKEEPGEGKFVKIQSTTGLCLHQHGNTTGNGDAITGWECVDQPNVRWEMVAYTSPAPTVPPVTMIEKLCGEYADGAVAQFNEKVAFEKSTQLDCRLGPNARWQDNRDNHYGWCVDNKADANMLKAENDSRTKELAGCRSRIIR